MGILAKGTKGSGFEEFERYFNLKDDKFIKV